MVNQNNVVSTGEQEALLCRKIAMAQRSEASLSFSSLTSLIVYDCSSKMFPSDLKGRIEICPQIEFNTQPPC